MNLESLGARGFHVVSEYRGECDERGIDGSLVLKRKYPNTSAWMLYICAHYRVGDRYGEPIKLS